MLVGSILNKDYAVIVSTLVRKLLKIPIERKTQGEAITKKHHQEK